MDGPQFLMLGAAVLCAAVWRWNATAAALAFSYFVVQFWWLIAGRTLDAGELFMVDVFTVALIFCKSIARCEDVEFRSGWHHLMCFARSPTFADRIILGIFPLMWVSYVANIDEFARWWALYGLAMAQFLLALGEAFHERRKANAPVSEPGIPSSGLMFAVARAGRWST